MRKTIAAAAGMAALLSFAGGAAAQLSPTVTILPGHGKSYRAFQRDDGSCQNEGNLQAAKVANQTGGQVVGNAIVGGIVGGLFGGGGGARAGAAAGAGDAVANGQDAAQRRFDTVYTQCMVAKGNRLSGDSDDSNDNNN